MTISRRTRIVLGLVVALVMAFVYVPLGVVVMSSFNSSSDVWIAVRGSYLQPGISLDGGTVARLN